MNYNYFIIGQGIAGSLLALELMERGKSVLIIDQHHISSASKVAAGLYNPVVFKRFAKSWMADELIPFAQDKYQSLEEKLKSTFHFKKAMYKVFASDDERKLWEKRMALNEFMAPVEEEVPGIGSIVKAPFGVGKVLNAGNLDTLRFLVASKAYFIEKEVLMDSFFDCQNLILTADGISWNGLSAEQIIFCEGSKAVENPFFKWLPFKLTKGEVLSAKVPGFHSTDVVNKGVFVLPVEDEVCRIGATYEWQDLSEEPTEKGKAEILEKFEKLIDAPYQVIGHQAGIRPTVSDRRP